MATNHDFMNKSRLTVTYQCLFVCEEYEYKHEAKR